MKLKVIMCMACISIVLSAKSDETPQRQNPAKGTEPGIHVAKFKGDCKAAISFTFDDAFYDQWELAVPMLEKYGIKATFFVTTAVISDETEGLPQKHIRNFRYMGWKNLRKIAGMGHELGNHSSVHVGYTHVKDDNELVKYITDAHKLISENTGFTPVSFCYPGNDRDGRARAIVHRYYDFTREYQWVYGGDNFSTSADMNRDLDSFIKEGKWIVPMIHGITEHYQHFPKLEILDEHLKFVKSRENELWIDTFGNVGRYAGERDTSVLNTKISEKRIEFTLTCPLKADLYNFPLTVIIPAPGEKKHLKAARDSKPIDSVKVFKDRILLDVVPGQSPVIVTWE